MDTVINAETTSRKMYNASTLLAMVEARAGQRGIV
jgi:hypothetical protein